MPSYLCHGESSESFISNYEDSCEYFRDAITVRKFSPIPCLLRRIIMNECQFLSNIFSTSLKWLDVFLP